MGGSPRHVRSQRCFSASLNPLHALPELRVWVLYEMCVVSLILFQESVLYLMKGEHIVSFGYS